MAANVKRVAAVLVSIVWLSLIVVLLAGFFVPGLREVLPAQVREFTDPEALRERLDDLTDSVAEGVDALFPTEPEAIETTTPDSAPSTPSTATPVPETPTAETPTAEPATPSPPPAMGTEGAPGDDATPQVSEQPLSITVAVAGQAELRSAPSEDADFIGLVATGGTITVNGIDPTGRWYRSEDGVWIAADDLVDAPLDQVPVVMTETQQPTVESGEQPAQAETPAATQTVQLVATQAIVELDANLRSGPGIEFDRVDGVNSGEEVSVVGQSADGEWYLLENGVWLFAALVVEAVDVPVVPDDDASDPLPTQEADTEQPETDTEQPDAEDEQLDTDTEQPDAEDEQPETDTEQPDADDEQPDAEGEEPQPVVNAPLGANLRSGPGVQFDRIEGLEQGNFLIVVAQDLDGDWLKLENGLWIFATLVDNVPEDLPVEPEEATAAETDDAGADDETSDESSAPADEAETDSTDKDDTQPPDSSEDEQTDEDEQDVLATVNTDANLRNGPGLDSTFVDSVVAGTQVTIIGRSDDDQWLQLDNGHWIFAALVDIVPTEAEEDADANDEADDTGAQG